MKLLTILNGLEIERCQRAERKIRLDQRKSEYAKHDEVDGYLQQTGIGVNEVGQGIDD